jgi:serine/threonine protein kinase
MFKSIIQLNYRDQLIKMDSNSIQINGYRITKILGHGGMATVYLAIQESFDRKVAVKVMSEQLSADPNFRDRFLQEAKIVSRLIHPNIVTVYDVGVINNHHYLSMEYIEGVDLKEKLSSISLFHLIKVIKEVALALDYAGRKGYVHRDIKPENIMVNNEDGRAVLMDFGIAKAFDSISEMTQTGTAIGTPYYMSPEQAKGKEVDWRSDIYSLGVVFFQVLTGQLPYRGDSAVAVGIMHLTDPIPKLPEYLQAVFQPIIDKLMAKVPDERYQNGEDIIKTLNEIPDSELVSINTEFTHEGHRDSGENINYSVSTPISASGLTKLQRNHIGNDNQDEATKIINIAPSNTPETGKNRRSSFVIPMTVITLFALGAGDYFSRGTDSVFAKLLSMTSAEKDRVAKENDDKLDALLKSTQLIEQQLLDNKKIDAEKLASKEKEDALIQSKLATLLEKSRIQEQQLASNNDVIDELYQTYQLISLLENDHPRVLQGLENIKDVYLEMIEEHLLNKQLALATKTLQKKLRLFPELESAKHILAIKVKIETLNTITALFTQAETHLANDKLSGNDDNNAHALYNKILAIAPDNELAQKGIINISDIYHQNASELIKNEQYKDALKNIALGQTVHPDSSTKFITLRNNINEKLKQNKRNEVRIENIKQYLKSAFLQVKAGNLLPPSDKNALSQYKNVLALEPKNKIALTAIADIEQKLLSAIPANISARKFTKAQQTINTSLSYFPSSKRAMSLQSKLNAAKKQYKLSQKPIISNLIIKGQDFTNMIKNSDSKLKADRTIYIGFEYSNFGKQTKVLQAILYAGSRSDKLSTTPVIIVQNKGVKYFKISRPVAGFVEGGYYLDFMLKGERISTNKFSIEN